MSNVADDGLSTQPLPALSQFFTWAPGQEPAPYDPPPTSTATPPPRPPSVPVINVVTEPRPSPRPGGRRLFTALAAIAAVTTAILVVWFVQTPTDHTDEPVEHGPPAPAADAPGPLDPRLASVLPPGYPTAACQPISDAGANAAAQCGANDDAPHTTGRFSLYEDPASLADALDRFIADTEIRVCPGNYQSPGPWRSKAEPDVPLGTLVCGITRQGHPRIGWTRDHELLLATIESNDNGPTLPQLYDWWSTHS